MRGIRWAAVVLILGLSGLLAGCCLLSGNPTVTISGPTTAGVGQAVTYSATATGGGGTYTYQWSFGASGQSATHTFQSAGSQMISVTVTDRCGKIATAQLYVNVGGASLTGNWRGSIWDARNRRFNLELDLVQSGGVVSGDAVVDGSRSSILSGSFSGGELRITFAYQWTGSTWLLVGTYEPGSRRIRGYWENVTISPGQQIGTWDVTWRY